MQGAHSFLYSYLIPVFQAFSIFSCILRILDHVVCCACDASFGCTVLIVRVAHGVSWVCY